MSDDVCPCGREASEAVGDPLRDHEPSCEVYREAMGLVRIPRPQEVW